MVIRNCNFVSRGYPFTPAQLQDRVSFFIRLIQCHNCISRGMVGHINARHHCMACTWQVQGSGSIHGVDLFPVFKCQFASLLVPPISHAPWYRLCAFTEMVKLPLQWGYFRVHGVFQRGAIQEIAFFIGIEGRQRYMCREKFDVFGPRIRDANPFVGTCIIKIRTWICNLEKEEDQDGSSSCLRIISIY